MPKKDIIETQETLEAVVETVETAETQDTVADPAVVSDESVVEAPVSVSSQSEPEVTHIVGDLHPGQLVTVKSVTGDRIYQVLRVNPHVVATLQDTVTGRVLPDVLAAHIKPI
jgi:hypothetical protein